MDLYRRYIRSLSAEKLAAYAARCGTTPGYLIKAIYKRPKFDGALARQLSRESRGAIPLYSLRPDIWPPKSKPAPRTKRSSLNGLG